MEPTGERSDEVEHAVTAAVGEIAAMEPTGERSDEPTHLFLGLDPVEGPQWSRPASGRMRGCRA